MTEEARAARNAYRREWYRKNPEKRREYEERYWCKRISKGLSDAKKSEESGKEGEMK